MSRGRPTLCSPPHPAPCYAGQYGGQSTLRSPPLPYPPHPAPCYARQYGDQSTLRPAPLPLPHHPAPPRASPLPTHLKFSCSSPPTDLLNLCLPHSSPAPISVPPHPTPVPMPVHAHSAAVPMPAPTQSTSAPMSCPDAATPRKGQPGHVSNQNQQHVHCALLSSLGTAGKHYPAPYPTPMPTKQAIKPEASTGSLCAARFSALTLHH